MRAWFLIMMGLAVGLSRGLWTGCAASGTTTSDAAATCGRTLTGVDVTVVVRIGRGSVSCPTAMTVEKSYAALIRAGARSFPFTGASAGRFQVVVATV